MLEDRARTDAVGDEDGGAWCGVAHILVQYFNDSSDCFLTNFIEAIGDEEHFLIPRHFFISCGWQVDD